MGKSYLIGNIVPRVTSITSSATPTVNTDLCDDVSITALATAITSMTTNLSGTPDNFQYLTFRIVDDGTARAIAWGASFVAMGAALPTTTAVGGVLTVVLQYNSVLAKWGCVFSMTGSSAISAWFLNGNTLTGSEHSPNEFFGSNNDFDVVFKENGTEIMRFMDALVGIRVPSPTALLHIKGLGTTTSSLFKGQNNSDVVLLDIKDNGNVMFTPQDYGANDLVEIKVPSGKSGGLTINQLGSDRSIIAWGRNNMAAQWQLGMNVRQSGNNDFYLRYGGADTSYVMKIHYVAVGDTRVALGALTDSDDALNASVNVWGFGTDGTTYSLLVKNNPATAATLFAMADNGSLEVVKGIDTTSGDSATINAAAGRFRKDTSGAVFTLTNNFITANSIILLTAANSAVDVTAVSWTVLAAAGSATITFVAAPTADFDMNFLVIN